jgi:integrase
MTPSKRMTPPDAEKGVLPMKGNIYLRNGKFIVRYRGVYRNCSSRKEAEEILTGLRFKDYEGTFDVRDYRKDQPLGFANLTRKYLEYRKGEIKCLRNPRNHLNHASAFFGNRSIKEIGFGDLEDLLRALPGTLSGKSKKNIFTTLHAFFAWAQAREYIDRVPKFPEIRYTLGFRNTVDKETQNLILEEVKRISYHVNPRIWFGIFLLANYPKVRPGELIQVNEKDIDRVNGAIWIRHTKEGREKRIFLLPEDLEFIKSLPQGFPEMPFFRHEKRKGVSTSHRLKYSGRFGKDYLYKWWKRATSNLGIEGVDLYGGTKHSTVTAAREQMTPEEIRRYLTEHQTNAAFDRYLQVDAQKQREASRKIRATQVLHKVSEQENKGKILKLHG